MTITGVVYSIDGSTIPGALVHDGRNGITTAEDGSFELQSEEGATITAVMVGFEQVNQTAQPYMEFTLPDSANSSLNAVEIIALKNRYNPAPATAALLLLLLLRIIW